MPTTEPTSSQEQEEVEVSRDQLEHEYLALLAENTRLKEQLDEANKRLNEQNEQIDDKNNRINELNKQTADQNRQTQTLQLSEKDLQEGNRILRKENDALMQKLAEVEKKLQEKEGELQQQMTTNSQTEKKLQEKEGELQQQKTTNSQIQKELQKTKDGVQEKIDAAIAPIQKKLQEKEGELQATTADLQKEMLELQAFNTQQKEINTQQEAFNTQILRELNYMKHLFWVGKQMRRLEKLIIVDALDVAIYDDAVDLGFYRLCHLRKAGKMPSYILPRHAALIEWMTVSPNTIPSNNSVEEFVCTIACEDDTEETCADKRHLVETLFRLQDKYPNANLEI